MIEYSVGTLRRISKSHKAVSSIVINGVLMSVLSGVLSKSGLSLPNSYHNILTLSSSPNLAQIHAQIDGCDDSYDSDDVLSFNNIMV